MQTDLFGEPAGARHASALARTWDYPPFSVLSARDGWWQDRKREWLALGIKSELGRGGGCNDMSPQLREMKPSAMMDTKAARGGQLMGQAFDNRHGLQSWQKDKRNGR